MQNKAKLGRKHLCKIKNFLVTSFSILIMRKEIKAASASKKAICSQLFVINYSVKFFGLGRKHQGPL
jgi:hypothetical protein